MAWSYDLLTPAEQSLFDRVSVFGGDFGFGAAMAVAEDRHAPMQSRMSWHRL